MRALVFCVLSACASQAATSEEPPMHHHDHDHAAHTAHHRFDDADRWAQVFDAPDRDAWQKPEELVALMQIAPGQTVADIGAGTGYFLPHLSRAAGSSGRVIAVDIEMAMIRHMNARIAAEKLDNAQTILGAPDDPKLPLGSVDRILIVDTWHHIEDRKAYAKRLKHALTQGGMVFIVDFTLETEKGPPPEMRVSAEAVKAELLSAGLAAEVVADPLADQYVVRARRT